MNDEVLTKKAAYIIYEQLDPWIFQVPTKTKDEIFADIVNDIRQGSALPLEKDGFILYIKPENQWLSRVHMFSKAPNHVIGIKAFQFLTNLVFDNSKIEKLYGMNHFKTAVKLSERVGWKHEGTLSKSFMTKEGDLIDQYIFGITRKENEKWRKLK
jgi:hypothetical protein